VRIYETIIYKFNLKRNFFRSFIKNRKAILGIHRKEVDGGRASECWENL
jgi:hypothetical protein